MNHFRFGRSIRLAVVMLFVAVAACAMFITLPVPRAEAGGAYHSNYQCCNNNMQYYNSNAYYSYPYQYSYGNYQYNSSYPYFPYNYYSYQPVYTYPPPRCTITLTALPQYNYSYNSGYYNNYNFYYPYGNQYGYQGYYPYGYGYNPYNNYNSNYYNRQMQLSWSSSNAYSASISNIGSVALSGSQSVYGYSANYVMTVNGLGGIYTCSTGNY